MSLDVTRRDAFLVEEVEGDAFTPISIFHRLQGEKKFLLESSYKHEKSGRFSFIGCDPYLEMKGIGGKCILTKPFENKVEELEAELMDVLKEQIVKVEETFPFPFFGGGVGYIGYDVVRQFETIGDIPRDDVNMPDAHLMYYEKVVVLDHQLQKIYIVLSNGSGRKSKDALQKEMQSIQKQLSTPSSQEFSNDKMKTASFESYTTKEHFIENVKRAQDHIQKGDIFQVVLSQRLQASFEGDPFSYYRHLRKSNPSPYMFYVDFEEYIVLGASPESFTKVQGQEVYTNPIAGTRKRGITEKEDIRLEKELQTDEKELAEHRMLVDLARNDLGRVCQFGSVELTKYMEVERFKHVMHLVSEVKGILREHETSLRVLRACLPAGTVSGAPKIRAMQIINELEPLKRGVYAGAVGYINRNGDLDFGLAIRTMVLKGNQAFVQAGAGVVLDSVPELEYEETWNKAKALLGV
ncbi:anthranilate synthase component I [Salirhabdus sp. Marseille-P4669]|uniref:anthranilate synthase component I n=1 Tax=Salirhabdus sp. Marseille-P4669 TaxID=2042310 RepID=UPI001F1AD5F9|nr:anthranilate synthase component I [Salirhabdus sp. Marseille-P4669]